MIRTLFLAWALLAIAVHGKREESRSSGEEKQSQLDGTESAANVKPRKALVALLLALSRTQAFTLGPGGSRAVGQRTSSNIKASTSIVVERPIIHWTVPFQKIGWQDEDTGIWYDEDGPRKGPPQNYWRQNLDQRAYQLDMDLVTQALRDDSDGGIDTKLDGASKEVEGKNSVRRPSRHRNLLGKWAPIYLACAKVAISSPNDSKPVDDNDSVGSTIEVPLTIEIFRTAGRKLAPKNHYGIFDASLAEGEEITLKTSDGAIDMTVCANEANEPVAFGKVTVAGSDRALQLGGVTYVSDYLLVQRNGEGRLSDIWLRCDDAYLGQNVEE